MSRFRKVIFAGPTYAPLAKPACILDSGFELLPPAKRGDIQALLGDVPGIVVLVDGQFHQTLAVGHAELRAAILAGWQVWGLGSMGAIRAFEMRALGMRGYGRVYEHFLGEEDFTDDEVALLHGSAPAYVSVSEPLVHLRYCLAAMEADGELSNEVGHAIADGLARNWYGHRTFDEFVRMAGELGGVDAAKAARGRIHAFHQFRIKSIDLETFFVGKVWQLGGYRPRPQPAPFRGASSITLGTPAHFQ